MQKVNPKPEYDVVIIGAGMGGLTAAALLSKAGLSVCVLEKEPHAGGYLAGFRRNDFRFDTAIHWLNQCAPGGMAAKIFDVIGADHPHAVSQKRIRRYKGETFDYLLTNNPDDLKKEWQKEFPEDHAGIEKFFKAAKKIGKAFFHFSGFFRSEETMNLRERLANKKNLLNFAMAFIPHIRFSGEKGIKKGLRKYFSNEKLHKVFSADSELLGCMVPIGWAYYGDFQSPPKGGGQVFPEWLEHVIAHFENEVFFKCNVQKIIVENGIAKGVQLYHRRKEMEVRGKYVVAACDVETLYDKMLPPEVISPKFRTKLQTAELYASSVTVAVALDCPAEDLGFEEEFIHLSSEFVSRADHNSGDPAKSEISILAPSQRDKSLAPEGCGTLTLFMPAYMDFNNQWHTTKDADGNVVRNEAYKKLKMEIGEAIIDRVEKIVAPGLREHILFFDVATPITHWRYTGNKNGTMMGAKPGRKNMQGGIAHYRTPIKNLLLSGHWAELGGGVPIAVKAAANTSLLILKEEKPDAFRLLANYMDAKISLQDLKDGNAFLSYPEDWIQQPTPAQKRKLREEKMADQEQEKKER